jgi:general secretion pathway protein I
VSAPERNQRGFTLVEVLAAFMILALSLTVLLRIFSGGLRSVDLAEDYTQAVMVAEQQLASVGIGEPLEAGETEGDWDERFHWQRSIESYHPWEPEENSDVPVTAFRVIIRVDWEHAGKPRRISLSSLRLQPAAQSRGRG